MTDDMIESYQSGRGLVWCHCGGVCLGLDSRYDARFRFEIPGDLWLLARYKLQVTARRCIGPLHCRCRCRSACL
jgi:hypothetical protein